MNLPEKEFSQLSNEEAKEQLLSILPEDEKTELETYDIFYFDRRGEGNWEISEGNPKMWLLRGKRVVPDIARGQQERVATFTVWENPKVGFKAASGFWIAGRYDMGDDIKKTCHQSFFAYEKDGMLYEFEPSRVWEMSQKTIAEYALNHGADRVYCYQALTVCYLVDYNVQVGYEAAIQHSPIRIPYDDFVVKEDSRSGGYAITEMVTLNNQMSLLDYGTVRTQSNLVWEKIGGIAHFAGEEAFYIRVAAAVGHVVVRPQPDDAMLLPGGEERPAQQAFGPRPVEIDRIGGIGARKLHRRDMAKAAGRLLHGHLRKGFGNEQLGQFEACVLLQHDLQGRYLGRSMEHGQPQRSPRRDLDTHTPGIDRSERLAPADRRCSGR